MITSIFKSLYLLEWCPIFDTSPLHQFSKFNNFQWVCWLQNSFHFCTPCSKTQQPESFLTKLSEIDPYEQGWVWIYNTARLFYKGHFIFRSESNLWCPQFSQKMNETHYPEFFRIVIFIHFLGESRGPLIVFQIYWPLGLALLKLFSPVSN